jgi:uncharacterized protein (DUF305 family)
MKNHGDAEQRHGLTARSYGMFALNMLLSLAAMYVVMFSMIDGWGDFRHNLNMLYMAVAMAAPMGVLMLATMAGMYPNKVVNAALYLLLSALFVSAFVATRNQTLIDDKQFIASMIPDHSGAILMCRNARLSEPELMKLCKEIGSAQRREIEQMEAIASRLERR